MVEKQIDAVPSQLNGGKKNPLLSVQEFLVRKSLWKKKCLFMCLEPKSSECASGGEINGRSLLTQAGTFFVVVFFSFF